MGQIPKAITFNIFGTVIDWEGKITEFFKNLMAKHNLTEVDPKIVQQRWEEIQFDYIQEYRPYRTVL